MLTLTKLTIIIAINRFVIIINFHNHFDKALMEIFPVSQGLNSWGNVAMKFQTKNTKAFYSGLNYTLKNPVLHRYSRFFESVNS